MSAKFLIPDKIYLKLLYKKRLGKKLNLKEVKTFNEKLQWLKLYDRRPIYSTMVDKYEVKKYVADAIGDKYIIPTIGVYEKFEDIDFDSLPNQFVIKCTHDSGGLVICKNKNKLDTEEVKEKINKSLAVNYYYHAREWPYKNVKPRILIEQYMLDKKTDELRDYKFFCFDGKVKFFKIDFNRFRKHQANYYSTDGKLLKFGEEVCPPDYNKKLEMPKQLKEMITIAEKLSRNIPFVRVDLYEINGKVYFGELTFFPASGFGRFVPEEWDEKIGRLIRIKKYEGKNDI
ncbi:glycosyl transferase [Candidatus Saccharibacteria bacterium]|nr:glycosyl transferase [Candidatus Saccharibacteria bacterium]